MTQLVLSQRFKYCHLAVFESFVYDYDYLIAMLVINMNKHSYLFIFRSAVCTFPTAERTFPTAERTYRSGEHCSLTIYVDYLSSYL